MTIREEISKALVNLGVDITTKTVKVRRDTGLFVVFVDDEYFGVWDKARKTFVD